MEDFENLSSTSSNCIKPKDTTLTSIGFCSVPSVVYSIHRINNNEIHM